MDIVCKKQTKQNAYLYQMLALLMKASSSSIAGLHVELSEVTQPESESITRIWKLSGAVTETFVKREQKRLES